MSRISKLKKRMKGFKRNKKAEMPFIPGWQIERKSFPPLKAPPKSSPARRKYQNILQLRAGMEQEIKNAGPHPQLIKEIKQEYLQRAQKLDIHPNTLKKRSIKKDR